MRKALLLTIAIFAGAHAFAATAPKFQGMNLAHSLGGNGGYGSADSLRALRDLRSLGITSVAITPFGFQRRADEAEIIWTGSGGGRWIDETDSSVRAVIDQAHGLGMSVMLKPHLWLRPPDWPGSIAPRNEDAWRTWFAQYRTFILHYAAIAQEKHVALLCIGNELMKTSVREREWRALIRDIRAAYKGRLTYGANFNEVEHVAFWDALDFIGVSAYFPLAEGATPTVEAIAAGWKPVAAKLEALSKRHGRRVIFTELGYPNRTHALERPWEEAGGTPDECVQADAFEAFFRGVWRARWLAGAFFWKWETRSGHGAERVGFLIEGRAAEATIRSYLRQ